MFPVILGIAAIVIIIAVLVCCFRSAKRKAKNSKPPGSPARKEIYEDKCASKSLTKSPMKLDVVNNNEISIIVLEHGMTEEEPDNKDLMTKEEDEDDQFDLVDECSGILVEEAPKK